MHSKKQKKCVIIVLGETQVGKTSFINRFNTGSFERDTLTTIGLDFVVKEMTLEDGTKVNVKIFDTAGQERFRNLTKNFYQKADGAILMYSETDEDSFNKIDGWLTKLGENAPENVITFLVANKCDSLERTVTKQRGVELSRTKKLKFYESSAKQNINVNKVFEELVKDIIKIKNEDEPNIIVTKENNNSKNNKKKKCC